MSDVLPDVSGFRPATLNGAPLVGREVATEPLSENDFHFGINGNVEGQGIRRIWRGNHYLHQLGPRAFDMAVRGGDVAEKLWREFKFKPGPTGPELAEFLTFFDDVGGRKAPRSEFFPDDARVSGRQSVAGIRKYNEGAADKKMGSLWREPGSKINHQIGARWSKVALEYVVGVKDGTIHFHLDGMGDISKALNKTGDHNHSVTSRELRYLRRYMNLRRFIGRVHFYNGYRLVGGEHRPVVVAPPF